MKERYEKNIAILEASFGFSDCLKLSEIELIEGNEYYEKFYVFCQNNLEIQGEKFGIKPAYFFYRNYRSYNAGAYKRNESYIINICDFYFQTLKIKFIDENLLFENENIKEIFAEIIKVTKVELGYLMFQSSTLFSYYHELAHLIQFKNLSEFEQFENSIDEDFDLIKNINELDADLNGVGQMFYHIVDYFEDIENNANSKVLIENLISISLSSLLISRLLIENFDHNSTLQKIYFKEKTHPHSLIRVVYMLDHLLINIKPNLPNISVDIDSILDNSFTLTKIYFQNNSLSVLAEMYNENSKEIRNYIEFLEIESENHKNLVRFHHHLF